MYFCSAADMKIPVGMPDFDERELSLVTDVMRSGWIARGKEVELFEQKLAEYLGVKYVRMVNSGTAAIEVALRALGIQNKEIITTTTSCAPTANAIIHSGNKPVMVDILPEDFNIDVSLIEKNINQNTGAILPVHLYGRPAKMDALMRLAVKHNLPVIEDVAQSMGARFQGKACGAIGNIGCFSLNINKIITTGEGGFIATNDPIIAENVRIIRNYGRDPSGSDYCYTHFGHNFKFTNLQAAIGLGQLEKIDSLIAARRKNAASMRELLKDVPNITLPSEADGEFCVYFSFPILLQKPGIRDGIKAFLEEKGIEVRTLFRPMCDQPYYKEIYGTRNTSYPNAEFVGENGLYLGCYPSLTKEQMGYMAESIKEGLRMVNMVRS